MTTRIPRSLTLERGPSMQHATIVEYNRIALVQLERVHGRGRLDKFGVARERVVELGRRVAMKGRLEGRAVANSGHLGHGTAAAAAGGI